MLARKEDSRLLMQENSSRPEYFAIAAHSRQNDSSLATWVVRAYMLLSIKDFLNLRFLLEFLFCFNKTI